MGKIQVKESAVLNARPEDVYATIADYRDGHPHILPKKNLYDLRVEQGGYGAGTVIRFKARALGVEIELYQRVSEPEPGRVLVEQDINSSQNTVTSFTVTPVEHGQKAHVTIATTLNATPGLVGFIEQIMIPRINQSIYRKELRLLEEVAQRRTVAK